jgi:hypothetical protein
VILTKQLQWLTHDMGKRQESINSGSLSIDIPMHILSYQKWCEKSAHVA